MLLWTHLLAIALAWTPANTTATSADGKIHISGETGNAQHTHGGAAAKLSGASFRVQHDRKEPIALSVKKIVFLRGYSCEKEPSEPRAEPVFNVMSLGESAESHQTLSVAAKKEVRVTIGFHPVEAYYTHCNRFAFAVTFQVGDEDLVAVAETNVMRVAPYNPR